MPQLSGGDLTNIRTQPIGRLFNLYVYQPVTLWTGTVGGSPSRGDRALTVATDTGNPALILADSTVRVTDSADDLKGYPSKVRARSYGAPTLTVADNDIDWAAGDKLIAVRLFEIWPRIPYIDATDVDNPIQYKDRDIAWADDDTAQPPKANAGPAAIGELNGGVCDIIFKNEGSFIVPTGAAVTSHLWDAIGGAPDVQAGAENTDTVTYRYDTAGYYYVKYVVTDGNGKTGHVYVPVIIDDGTYPISRAWPGDRYWDKSGWILSRRLLGIDATPSTFFDGAPVFLVADTQITGAGAFTDNRSNLRWSGWLMSDETKRGAYDRETSYRAVSSCHILQTIPAFPVGLRSDASPADWYEFTQLNLDSVVILLLRWQSTVLQVCDYHPDGDWTNRLRPGEDCTADDILTQVDAVLAAMFANLRCDRQGILRAMRDEWHISAAEEAARATVMTLANTDYHDVRYGPRRHRARVREIRALGVDGSSNPYIAGAPGEAPLDGGRPGEVTKLSPKTQAELNQWAGQELSTENWSIPLVLRMAGEFDAVDPALGEYIAGTLSSFDSELPDGPYSVVGVRFVDDHETRHTMGEWELIPDPTAYGAHAGEARDIPEEPDPPDPPDIPDDPPIPIIPPAGWPTRIFVGTDTLLYYTVNFTGPDGDMPTWSDVTGDLLTGSGASGIFRIAVDPIDPEDYWYAMVDDTATNPFGLYKSIDQGANWTLIMDSGDLPGGDDPRDFCVDRVTGVIYLVYEGADTHSHVHYSSDYGANWLDYDTAQEWALRESECPYAQDGVLFIHRSGTTSSDIVYKENGTWTHTQNSGVSAASYAAAATPRVDQTYVFVGAYLGDAALYRGVFDEGTGTTELNTGDGNMNFNRVDHLWFHPTTQSSMRYVQIGDWSGKDASKVYVSTDDGSNWSAAANISTTGIAPYILNIHTMCWKVQDGEPSRIIYGGAGHDGTPEADGDVYESGHHIFAADIDEDGINVVDPKAGDNTDTGVDSILDTAGGVVIDGIQVVEYY